MRIEPPPPRVSTTRLADPGHGPAIVALVAVAFVTVATASSLLAGASGLAQRSGGNTGRVDPGASDAAAAAPHPSDSGAVLPSPPDEPSLPPGEIACVPAGWRLAYVGSIASWPVKTSLVVEPAAASDPLDARIPVTYLGHDVISGLGACAPPTATDDVARPAVISRAWRVGRVGGSDVVQPIGLVVLTGTVAAAAGSRPDALALVRPAGTGASWTPGVYVLELGLPGAAGQLPSGGTSEWLRIEVDAPTP